MTLNNAILSKYSLSITEGFSMNGLPPSTLYDELELEVLRNAYNKYSLEELEQKLK